MVASPLFVGRRFLIWVVASAAALEAVLEALVSVLQSEPAQAVIWGTGAALVFGAIAFAERVKVVQGE